jgi:hypothetical protein
MRSTPPLRSRAIPLLFHILIFVENSEFYSLRHFASARLPRRSQTSIQACLAALPIAFDVRFEDAAGLRVDRGLALGIDGWRHHTLSPDHQGG